MDGEVFRYEASSSIRLHALGYPDAAEGTSCVNRAFSAGGKNFAFLGEVDDECRLRLKLGESIPEVDDRFEVGAHGWTMIRFHPDEPPNTADLERWVGESFRLLAPKRLVAQLDA